MSAKVICYQLTSALSEQLASRGKKNMHRAQHF